MKYLKTGKALLLFALVALSANAETLSRTKAQMGTLVTISVEEKDKAFLTPAFEIVNAVDKSLSSYDQNSNVYKLNRDKNSSVDDNLYEALCLSEKYYAQTEGYFNVAIGSITKDLYRFGEDERVPNARQLQNANVAFEKLKFTRSFATLAQGVKVDFGGMGKGFAVSKVAEFFRTSNVKKAVIEASGDIRCVGVCEIEVNNPFSSTPLVAFEMEDMGVSTSGNYNRYVSETKNNHLINPNSIQSARDFISITLVSKLPSVDLDAYATAASVMPRKKAFEFLDAMEAGYVVLDINRTLTVSENMKNYVERLVVNDTFKK